MTRIKVLNQYWKEKKEYQNTQFEEKAKTDSATLYNLVPNDVETILDLGSGSGRIPFYFWKRNHGLNITCTDLSSISVEQTKNMGFNSIQIDLNDAFADKINGEYDLVTAFGIIEHVQYSGLFFKQLKKLAKKYVLLRVTNHFYWKDRIKFLFNLPPKAFVSDRGHSTLMNKRHLVSLVKKNGFEIVYLLGDSLWSRSFTVLLKKRDFE